MAGKATAKRTRGGQKAKAAIIGSGNIGTDLLLKIMRKSEALEVAAFVGIDPQSEGLRIARELGVAVTHAGAAGLQALDAWPEIEVVFDATSAGAHAAHSELVRLAGKAMVDLTPAAIGPYVVPVVNGAAHLDQPNVNMVTCGGQATIPIVAAVSRVGEVPYAEIVASIASKSAGPGTRANIDEFTHTTSRGIEAVGGARRGKAIIILNPADPPMIMRNTVFVFCAGAEEEQIDASVRAMVAEVQKYVPGYRLKQEIQFERYGSNNPLKMPGVGEMTGIKTTVLLEVEGAGHYLPKYAGNLDVMTSAAMRTGEQIAARRMARRAA